MSPEQPTADAPGLAKSAPTGQYPLIDPDGVTFLYHGKADAVGLRCWIHGLPASQPFERVKGTEDWLLRIDLPPGSRIEYKFEIVRDGRVEWILDPLNPLQATDPFGANSVVQGYGYDVPTGRCPIPTRAPGTLDEFAGAIRAARRARDGWRLRPGALPSHAPLSAARRARRDRLPALRRRCRPCSTT